MASETKCDWGFWGFWVAVSGVLVAAGAGLYTAQQPVWGFRLIIIGLALVVLCILAVVVPPLRARLSEISRYVLSLLHRIVRAIVGAFVAMGAWVLRPSVERILRTQEGSSWTAGRRKFGAQGLDFKVLGLPGHRVAKVQFAVFPDYLCKTWRVGFALSPSPLAIPPESKSGVVVCALESENWASPSLTCRLDNKPRGPSNMSSQAQKASFLFGLTTYPKQGGTKLGFSANVDGSASCQFDIPVEYACYLTLFAWAGGQNFRVDFAQIHVSWVPE
jgi:hypothetical protein